MLTNEQCIEVAEKVWGWDKIIWCVVPLKQEVNSWQGFGRTISNISRILKNEHELEDFMFDAGPNFDSLIKGLITEDEFFELIQTAALEVLKDD